MTRLLEEFPNGEVTALAVNWAEPLMVVLDYISDTGIRSPVVMDNPTLLDGCLELPVGEDSLYQHFEDRVGLSGGEPPFPLQIVLDENGAIAYTSKTHQPDVVIETIHGLLAE